MKQIKLSLYRTYTGLQVIMRKGKKRSEKSANQNFSIFIFFFSFEIICVRRMQISCIMKIY